MDILKVVQKGKWLDVLERLYIYIRMPQGDLGVPGSTRWNAEPHRSYLHKQELEEITTRRT
jgi:hypothetical protein